MRLKLILGMLALVALMMPVCGQETAEEWFNKGNALADLSKYDEAIQAYDEAIRLDPEYAAAWVNKGITLNALGKHNESIQACDEAIRLDPELALSWIVKGAALHTLGKYDEAIQACDEAIRLDPEFAMAWSNKGLVLYKQGKNEEAVLALDEAIRLDPQDTSARELKSAILVESAELWQASNGAWVTDLVTDTTWLDGTTYHRGQGFTVFITIHSEDYSGNVFVATGGKLTLDGYARGRKVWSTEFYVSRYDFGNYERPFTGEKCVGYESPRVPFSDLSVSKDTLVDIEMTFTSDNGYVLEDDDTIVT